MSAEKTIKVEVAKRNDGWYMHMIASLYINISVLRLDQNQN